jgi:hypothetical protein
MTNPLPLVTATFTVDELAKMAAGVTLLRREWTRRFYVVLPFEHDATKEVIEECTALINRIAGLVSEEQGNALLSKFIKQSMKKPQERKDNEPNA